MPGHGAGGASPGSLGVIVHMNTRAKFRLKVLMTVLFVIGEVLTFGHSVVPAFEQGSVGHVLRGVGTQTCFVLAVLFLWFGERTRISFDAGWGALALGTLIFGLI